MTGPVRVRERAVQAVVMQLLRAKGFRVYRRNVAGFQRMAKGGFMRVGEKGQADLYGWHAQTGRHLEVEVKSPGETPSQEQHRWLEAARADGCVAFWCDGAERCLSALVDFGFR